jgi:hypothetical protein
MSNADMLVEMIRLGDQFGKVTEVHLYKSGYCHIDGETKDGKKFSMSLDVKEEKKDGN